ncbi:hypothetical protein OUZ56_001519 [Daphnia magna]|uniref:Uncharacterized protein n=1 Tax=Daphnia magna TaxID=35525 RepID=A0ABR0A2X1_9CRUS|nr:hypothetical protein OUZ56_001519 [Daphnia magna]
MCLCVRAIAKHQSLAMLLDNSGKKKQEAVTDTNRLRFSPRPYTKDVYTFAKSSYRVVRGCHLG